MKLYAQHGYGEGDKINEGLKRKIIDGVIYSPKDISLHRLKERLSEITQANVDRFFDPQYYLCPLALDSASRLGYLLEDYGEYFRAKRRRDLEREDEVAKEIKFCLEFQLGLDVTGIIAPNILIPRSLDSIDAAISKNFIRNSRRQFAEFSDSRKLYATLAVSRDALTNIEELANFLDDIVVYDERPDGFYILVSTQNTEARSDIFNADVIGAWMYINHTLRINGFEVINGYSDLVSPFLGATGGFAGATGWWSNLRQFSQDRFVPSEGGGRQPNLRYLSTRLLNRVAYFELDSLRNKVPEILNGLPSDSLYSGEHGSEPQNRAHEVLQSWEALKRLNDSIVVSDQRKSLQNCHLRIEEAGALYQKIYSVGLRLDPKSNEEHLEPLREGVRTFEKLAEIDAS
jgi:hypothetical protein